MCGRFQLNTDQKSLELLYSATFDESPRFPRYNVAPTAIVPMVGNDEPAVFQEVRWGLKPAWMKVAPSSAGMINIRAETLTEKPFFRKNLEERRCLIPATGFYEWKKEADGKKTPYYIGLRERPIFSFAGVWADNKNKEGETERQFSIITTTPNEMVAEIHNRMPVILRKEDEEIWLGESTDELAKLLCSYDQKEMHQFQVDGRVNNPRFDSELLLHPV